MATALKITLATSIEGFYYETDALAPGSQHINKSYVVEYRTGTGTQQANVLFRRHATSGFSLDLTNLTDFLGAARTLSQVSIFQVINNDIVNDVTIIGDFLPVLTFAGPFTTKPGGVTVQAARITAHRFPVTPASANDLTFSDSTDFDVLIVGNT